MNINSVTRANIIIILSLLNMCLRFIMYISMIC